MFGINVPVFFKCLFVLNVIVIGCVCGDDDLKTSLTFVIDDTGSMDNDIQQAKASARSILDTAIRTESSQIKNFVLVTFNDPDVHERVVTTDPVEFESALGNLTVYGGGDCPEMAMTGIELALRTSRPGSFLYVFTDASAKDYLRAEVVRSLAQKKQSRITFLVTGDCGIDESYQVYHQIAAVSSGQMYRVTKDEVSKVLTSVPYLITGKSSVLTSKYLKKGCHNIHFDVDTRINDVSVSASGFALKLEEIKRDKTNVTFELVVDTQDIKIARIKAPEPGAYVAKVCSDVWASVVVLAKTEFGFQHGFAEIAPKSIQDTARQPIEKTKSHLAILLTDSRKTIVIKTVEILDLDEKLLHEIDVERVKEDFYVSNKFYAPKNVFKIAIKGYDSENGVTIRRISKTAIETQKPFTEPIVRINEGSTMEVEYGANIMLKCKVLGFPTPDILWTNNKGENLTGTLNEQGSYKFTNKLEIKNLTDISTFTCTAKNKNGEDSNSIKVNIRHLIDVQEVPEDVTVEKGKEAKLTCRAKAVPFASITWIYNGQPVFTNEKYEISGNSQLTVKNVSEETAGVYQCLIENKFEKKTYDAKVTLA